MIKHIANFKKISISKCYSLFVIKIIIFLFFSLSCNNNANQNKKELIPISKIEQNITENIKSKLPKGSYLREYKKLTDVKEDIYIGLYVTNFNETTKPIIPPVDYRVEDSSTGYFSDCISEINGQSLKGKYFAFVYKAGEITSTYEIPKGFDNEPIFLCLYNTPYNINYHYNKTSIKEQKSNNTLEIVDLINLVDYTGDGKKNEFQLQFNNIGCGFADYMIIGYNEGNDKVLGYPIFNNGKKYYWYGRFHPLGGYFSIEYDCGDHGSETYTREDFKFNEKLLQYDNVYSIEKKCN